MRRVLVFTSCALFVLLQIGGPVANQAEASFPGQNGRIAFTSYRDGTNIWSMDANGGNVEQLTFGDAWDDDPAWSPDEGHS